MNYYNEFNPQSAAMLRQMMLDGIIPKGEVDERSIIEVTKHDLRGYKQHHFFAGIGGWPIALAIVGWPEDEPVWTGSCPCQPFSSTGKNLRQSDERHLWPTWSRLISESKPPIIFGEQVDEAIATGWWDDVCYDLEKEGYACAAAILPATSVQKNHERNRLFFVANSTLQQRVYEPNAWKEKKRLYHDQNYGETDSWDEAMPKVYSIYDGIPTEVSLFHAFGNAIVPQKAANFIEAAIS